jgi:hypothetical protein
MSATFTLTINGLKTKDENGLEGVIKIVNWTLHGQQDGVSFELPQETLLRNPDPGSFVPLSELTPQVVTSWMEARSEHYQAVKAHIQYVLDREVEKAGTQEVAPPWA